MSFREAIAENISLLASPSAQLAYEKDVPIADVPAELVCMFCDDLYHPKSAGFIAEFSESELKDLAHLYGLLVEASAIKASSVAELLKEECWRSVVKTAKNLSNNLTWPLINDRPLLAESGPYGGTQG